MNSWPPLDRQRGALKSGGLQPGGLQLLEPPIRELDNQTPVGASSLGAYIWVLRLNPSHLDFATKVWGPTAWGPTVSGLSLYPILKNIPHMPGTGAIDTMPCYSAVTWYHDKAHSSTTMAPQVRRKMAAIPRPSPLISPSWPKRGAVVWGCVAPY